MPNDDTVLDYCFAWQSQKSADTKHEDGDDDADDQKSQRKFPHHKSKGGPANIPACRNGLARLEGANIPDADRAGVKAHLQAHIDDFNKKSGDGDEGKSNVLTPGRITALASATADERVQQHLPRVQRYSNRAQWYTLTDFTDGTPARLDVYDEIGFWGVSAAEFNAVLQGIQAPSIEVHVNSPGGDVFDGLAICNLLRAHPKPVDVVVDGLAASAASYIAMAGDTVTMMPNSQMMIHDASGICMGNAADMTEMADLLDKMSANIAGIYATKTGRPSDEWRAAMKAETWYSAEEAVTAGLADRVGQLQRGQATAQPSNHWNTSFYRFNGRAEAPTPVLPVISPTPAAPARAAVTEPVVEPARQIDPEKVRAALRGAFATPKEARR